MDIEVKTSTTIDIHVDEESVLPLRNILGYFNIEMMEKELSAEEFAAAYGVFGIIAQAVNYAASGEK